MSEPDPAGSREDARFDVQSEGGGIWVVTVTGEIDLASEGALRAFIEKALDNDPSELVFDLSGVRFIDSSGIAQMLLAAKRAGTVSVRNPSNIAQRVIEVSGLAGTLKSSS